MSTPPVYVVSGGAGASGEQLVRTALAQFNGVDVPVIILPHVRESHQLDAIVSKASTNGGIVVHTLVNADLRTELIDRARQHNVVAIDLMGPLLSQLSAALGRIPLGQPGLYRQLNEARFDRIEAIEFTMAHDDGRNSHEWHLAEIVLAGISRVGKTPLSMYLAVLGWKVANVPLIHGMDAPDELFQVDRSRVVGLIVEPGQLMLRRQLRQRRMGVSENAGYADLQELYDEIESARRLFTRGGFPAIDITNKSIEESADEVIATVTRRIKTANE